MRDEIHHQLGAVAELLKKSQRIAAVAHVKPDGDAVGSVLGLAMSLRAMGKEVFPILEDGVPASLQFLPGTDWLRQPTQGEVLEVDVAVALDTATHTRIGDGCLQALSAAPVLVNMDHHISNPGYGDLTVIDSEAPATGQIVYELLSGFGFPLDDAIRQNLFTAISTDTGSFQYPATGARTHRIAAEMIEAGLDTADLAKRLYQTYPMRRMQLLKALLNEARFSLNGKVASWILTRRLAEEIGLQAGDNEDLIDTLRMIEGVVAAVVFEELEDGKVRVSARSKSSRLDVSEVCGQFGGGGHRAAAGARMKGPSSDASERFLKALEDEVRQLD
jgi:phosphoesterase RecJ-like protein